MPLRFRNRLRIFPGIYLNLGKNGISTTIGPRGANINIGKNGVYLNTGIPGTGISNRERIFNGNIGKPNIIDEQNIFPLTDTDNNTTSTQKIITSEGLEGLKEHLKEAKDERESIAPEIADIKNKLAELQSRLSKKQNGFFSLFTAKDTIEKIEVEIKDTTQELDNLNKQYEESKADINVKFDTEFEEQYKRLSISFSELIKSNKIWDITTETINTELKSSAKTIVERKEINFKWGEIDFIKSEHSAFHLQNADGSDLFIYPAFVLLLDNQSQITLIDLKELNFTFHKQRFQEQKATIPSDSQIIDNAWYKSNKDGSRDLRFVGNYQIPVVNYGAFYFKSSKGLNETYYISNADVAENFANEFKKYLRLLNQPYSSENNTNKISNPLFETLPDSLDPLINDAATLIVTSQSGSTSLLQRRMKLGYNRAGRIMDQLEQLGIVGVNQGSSVREVLIRDTGALENIFKNYRDHVPRKINLESSSFSKEYFDLLIDFMPKITETVEKLKSDEKLQGRLKDAVNGITIGEFIEFCIFYDFYQILKKISKGEVNSASLETFALVLFSGKIIKKLSSSSLAMEYETLKIMFSKGTQKEIAESMMKFVDVSKPLNISISSHDKETLSKKLGNDLTITTALKVVNDPLFDEYATVLYRFATIISKADNVVSNEEENILKAIYQLVHNPLSDEENKSISISEVNEKESLDDVLNELETLIGLDSVKQEIKSLINYIKIQKEREKVGLKSSQISYHCVFTGSPGTGKTTIARIVAKIYMHLGILKKGQLVETDRSGLIAEYSGQTAVKVNKTIDSALDGILFIDEAYSLVGENRDDFGKEAVATLIKRMEDDRDKLIVILAGYTQEMKNFIDVNPGLKSRFNRYIEFADYSPVELAAIFKLNCSKLDYNLTADANKKLIDAVTTAFSNRNKSFGNGRFSRNLFEKTIENQANRIAGVASLSKEILTTIMSDDIPVE